MSKKKSKKKTIVTDTSKTESTADNKSKSGTKKVAVNTTKSKVKPTVSRTSGSRSATAASGGDEMIFGRSNYILMAAGAGLIALGMILMLGGWMPDNNTWDDDIIYSTRRTVLAPICILAGLVVEIFAIFKK